MSARCSAATEACHLIRPTPARDSKWGSASCSASSTGLWSGIPSEASPQTDEACGFCGSDRRFMTSSGKTSLNRLLRPGLAAALPHLRAGAHRAKAGARFASYGLASHAAIINGKDSRKGRRGSGFQQNIENNPMQSSMAVAGMDALSYPCENILTRRANQWYYSTIAPFAKRPWPCPAHGPARHMALPDNGLL